MSVDASALIASWQKLGNLRKALDEARAEGVEVRGIAVINPGNPTGNILAEEQIRDIIQVKMQPWPCSSGFDLTLRDIRVHGCRLGGFERGSFAAHGILKCSPALCTKHSSYAQ